MFNKILAIILKELRTPFTDRTLLILMFALPLVVATIIAVTFGGAASGGSPIEHIPVALVNLDPGGDQVSNGAVVVSILNPAGATVDLTGASGDLATADDCPEAAGSATDTTASTSTITLDDLLDVTLLDDPAAARAGVEAGTYAVAVIIPANFTASLTYSATNTALQPVELEVYGDPQRPLAVSIVRSIVDGIVTNLGTGNIAIAATLDTVTQQYGVLRLIGVTGSESFNEAVGCAFVAEVAPVSIDRQNLDLGGSEFNILVFTGSTQAIFVAIFAANGFANVILQERRNWTLQRLLMSPTSRITILFAKMLATFTIILIQLVILLLVFTLIGSLLEGELTFIWGDNLALLAVVLVAVSLAVSGLGSITAAASRSPEQSATIGSIFAMAMAVTGGAFGFQLPAPLNYPSLIYWGSDAFLKVSLDQPDIGINLLVLVSFGLVTFLTGLFLFNRRLDKAN